MLNHSLEQATFQLGEVNLQAKVAGPAGGPLVLLLHGFPEFWYSWRNQIAPLAAAGFRVVALDQRGYNRSSKPRTVRSYAMGHLVADVLAVIAQCGKEAAVLIGHDWGALVAWSVAAFHPEKVERLVILNVPHPAVMPRFFFTRPGQLLRSWYMFFFQVPWLPERLFSAVNFKSACESLVRTSRPGTFTPDDLERYREAWAQPGAVRSMIHWYRALLRPFSLRTPKVVVPTLILWGKKDAFLKSELAPASVEHCTQAHLVWFPAATHWIHQEEPESVNRSILDFLRT